MPEPLEIPILRTAENKPGTVYDETNAKRLFAEDWNKAGEALDNHEERIVELEETGGGGDNELITLNALGSSLKYQASGGSIAMLQSSSALANQQMRFIPVYINKETIITGVAWLQQTTGNYTANNNNKVGLYSYSAGTLTKVAESTNDGNIWKQSANQLNKKAFTSPYTAQPGLYFVALLYCNSSQSTAPQIRGITNGGGISDNVVDFTNNGKLWSVLISQTDLGASYSMGDLSNTFTKSWIGLY